MNQTTMQESIGQQSPPLMTIEHQVCLQCAPSDKQLHVIAITPKTNKEQGDIDDDAQ